MHKLFFGLIRISLITGISIVLFACASINTTPSSTTSWQEHQDLVENFQDWALQGRLNIRNGKKSDTITINWRQNAQQFSINLSGTLGLGALQIEGNDQGVRLEKSGEAPVLANSLEEISSTYLGYEFPVNQLYYWIRGIPAPGESQTGVPIDVPINVQLNENQQLKSLQQGEWQLEYDRYQEQDNGLSLPGRIKMESPPYRLTFIIRHW